MKRRSIESSSSAGGEDPTIKKQRPCLDEVEDVPLVELGEDLVWEVLKRADARTLGRAACVSRRWRRLAEDERLWEAVCTPQWAGIRCGNQQLRSVVLSLGGFRRLHATYMVPLRPSVHQPAPRPAVPFPLAPSPASPAQRRWGKDEVQLSLSLLSIGFFEKMNGHGFKPCGGKGCP